MRITTPNTQHALAAAVALGLLAAACGSSDGSGDGGGDGASSVAVSDVATTATPDAADPDDPDTDGDEITGDTEATGDTASSDPRDTNASEDSSNSGDTDLSTDTASDTSAATPAEGGDVLDQLIQLSGDDTFVGDNSEESIASAVAAFDEAGLDFSPADLAAPLPTDCSFIDTGAVSQIVGADVTVETLEGFTAASPGYLSCSIQSADDPDVALAYVYLAPDTNGADNWGAIGTLDGAFDIAGLGDAAIWSDGSGADNTTNKSTLQLRVDQGGTQSLFQGLSNEPQVAIIGEWSIPEIILALAAVDASLT